MDKKKQRKSRTTQRRDPHARREAARYEQPIASRELILAVITEADHPVNRADLETLLGIHDENGAEALRRRLNAMLRDGQLVRNRRGCYALADQFDLVQGRVVGHPDGFGFLVTDDEGDDVYLSARQMRALFHGDRVLARITGLDRRGRREGDVVEVLKRNTHTVVGRFYNEKGVQFVTPDNKRLPMDIPVPAGESNGATHGQIVSVEIIEQPSKRSPPVGRVVEVLGDHMAPGMEIDISIRSHDIPQAWPPAVEAEIDGLGEQVPAQAKRGREDLRELPLVTIDGADARDFDDAVFCEATPGGWRLLVAIADVSHYVHPDTALDSEAFERGNSVYFPERVIPMLPEVLSNGLCSLNPEVDRLCMACEIIFNREGRMIRSRFSNALMRSHARLTYTEAAAIMVDRDPQARKNRQTLLPHLDELYRLYKVLRKGREKRGAIDFETTETRIIFGAGRKIERIVPLVRNDAHKVIEECMVAANVAAARYLERHKMPTLNRVHAAPTGEKVADLQEFLNELGLGLRGGSKPTARDYSAVLKVAHGRPDEHLINTVLLRSMPRAEYSPENIGHFGLAHEHYAHFTSPIRRYPDLLVHRAIRHVLAGKKPKSFPYTVENMQIFGEHCSATERRADEATRDAIDWLKCEYMLDKIGETYSGIITATTSFGIFVELQDIYVEGLVHVTALGNDYYHFDPTRHWLIGERTNQIFRLGDPLNVKVVQVNLDDRKIDFELSEKQKRKASGSKKDQGKHRRSHRRKSR
ncbi:MAG: ribonuclease R [Gammaproteobacteria bacterium]|jgi:ribonuclease R|nr:ribonuclease R [Gammaproteobacteria bacterium]